MIALKQPFSACSQMFKILIGNYTSGEIFGVAFLGRTSAICVHSLSQRNQPPHPLFSTKHYQS